jgi:hypothetical protein
MGTLVWRSRLGILGIGFLVCSCQSGSFGAPAAPQAQTLQNFTKADLESAIATAQSAGPAGAEIVPCFQFLLSIVQNLPSPPSGAAPAAPGLASIFVQGDLLLNNITVANASGTQSEFEVACGPLALHLQNQGMTLASEIAALAALLAKIP